MAEDRIVIAGGEIGGLATAIGLARARRQMPCDRDPLPTWTDGCVAMVGDAAHPMLQYFAQGV